MKWIIAGAWLLMTVHLSDAASREGDWKKVGEALRQGLPRTAITNLEPIMNAALKEGAYPEAAKALAQRIVLEAQVEGNRPDERIRRLEAQLGTVPQEMLPMLNTLLAHWYWEFFQQNRWRFLQRTATAEQPGEDILTWDLPRIFKRIDEQFQKALAAEEWLKSERVADWNALLQPGTMPDAYRPTLYDFVAHQALSFYTAGEQAGARQEPSFEFSAESPALGTLQEFLAWQPELKDSRGENAEVPPELRAARLFQQLLFFHRQDSEPRLALAHVDLERLTWAGNTAYGESRNDRYEQALRRFIEDWADSEISALARARLSALLQQKELLVEAREVAKVGAEVFPESVGGKVCRNLVNEIEAKSLGIVTEKIWNTPLPDLEIRYRNLEKVYFRALLYDWEAFLQRNRNRPENLNERERRELLAKAPLLAWSVDLPPTKDYKEAVFSTKAPAALKPGFYLIVASPDPDFSEKDNPMSLADVWVSELALITRSRDALLEGFVLEGLTGEPLKGAEIMTWYLDRGNRLTGPAAKTDENGFFSLKLLAQRGHLLRARHEGREVATSQQFHSFQGHGHEGKRPFAQTIFFTDRALYRPGQMIQYKGICYWVDREKDVYEVLKGEKLSVVFRDVNGNEIARQSHQANDFGSFSGTFAAPRDRLMGQMTLVAEGRAQGAGMVRVEEYKRPKFQVGLEAPKDSPKLNDRVQLLGRAISYTGAAVDGAKVQYRVIRHVRMPWWRRGAWGIPSFYSEPKEISHGSLVTTADGTFTIEFTATPDLRVPESEDPRFDFQIHADVTDPAGETRSATRHLAVGYTTMEAILTAKDWQVQQEPVRVQVEAKTLAGEPQVAEGSLKVFALQAPESVVRARLIHGGWRPRSSSSQSEEQRDLSNPENWPLAGVVSEKGFTTDTNGIAKLEFPLAAGAYRAVVATTDRFGKPVKGELTLLVVDPGSNQLDIKVPHLLTAPSWEGQPGDEFQALWGTGYDSGRAFVEVEHRGRMVQRFWTSPGVTQQSVRVPISEGMRGGFTVHVTQVRENRAYLSTRRVQVPWSNKDLDIHWEHLVSKLEPGQKSTWTAVIKPRVGIDRLTVEMVAALYDVSLDAFAPHGWVQGFDVFRQEVAVAPASYVNQPEYFRHLLGHWDRTYEDAAIRYRSFLPELTGSHFTSINSISRRFFTRGAVMEGVREEPALAMAAPAAMAFDGNSFGLGGGATLAAQEKVAPSPDQAQDPEIVAQVSARKNLNETAFFFPTLTADSNGVVRMTFTMPEALTEWRFLGFAHDAQLRSGFLEGKTVTAKDLMVQPNPPRFLREGDTVEFTVKVSNQSDQPQRGTARLSFTQALNEKPADQLLKLTPIGVAVPGTADQSFEVPPKESRTLSWRLTVPDAIGFLTYKATASAGRLSDGEEGAVPVLSRKILITESIALPLRGPGTRKFQLEKLRRSGESDTLRHQSLTVQMVSQPAWYAVLALPYLMEFPHECSEQVFNRAYANALARHIANSDVRIRTIFDQWKNTPALESPLEKNEELKAVLLEETPWMRQAAEESRARRNVGMLFDDNRLNHELGNTLSKLAQMQLEDGSWPWFPGGPRNEYITLYIATGFGRLRHLGLDVDASPAVRSLQRLDMWMRERYDRIHKLPQPEQYVPSPTDALYLYGRSFFLRDLPIIEEHQAAFHFFLAQSKKHWLKTGSRQTQAHMALALKRFSSHRSTPDSTPEAILQSLKERSVTSQEMGRFWRDTEYSWWWYRAPIETQALMIEAFDEIANDQDVVEECRVWLLKQKQTQDWKTTKATADAVYALLLRGANLLSSSSLVQINLGGTDLTPGASSQLKPGITVSPVEAGTGFYEARFEGSQVKPRLGQITTRKSDPGVAWGSVHWQYLEDIGKVSAHEGTPLKLSKRLFRKLNTARGPELQETNGHAEVGDELVVRIELRTDRDMEYIHMKDQRGSGTEPVNVLSRYKYQDGLAYYESTRDTASHFFIDYLPKGTYVFEYSTRVQLRGLYQTGVTEVQCMYAPEFTSHSESIPLTVK